MGDVTAFRRRGPGAPAAVPNAHGSAEPAPGEPTTIATLIARAFGVLEEPASANRRSPAQLTPGAPARHLHLVRDASDGAAR